MNLGYPEGYHFVGYRVLTFRALAASYRLTLFGLGLIEICLRIFCADFMQFYEFSILLDPPCQRTERLDHSTGPVS